MTVTIQQVFRPLLIMCFIIGLGIFPLKQPNPKIRWIAYLNILYPLTIWFIYVYLLYYTITLYTWKVLYHNLVWMFIMVVKLFTVIISTLTNFYHQKRFQISMKKLAAVNDTLKELNIPKMYQKTHIYSKLVIMGWIVYCLAVNFSETLWWISLKKDTKYWRLFLSHIMNYGSHVNEFMDLLFIFLLWYIGTRFDKLNEHMQCLTVREEHGLRCKWKKPIAIFHHSSQIDNYKQTLWISMHLYSELCRITREINLIFGTHITFEMAIYLFYITSLSYGFCMMLMQKVPKEILQSLMSWFCLNLQLLIASIKLYIIHYICESVMIKANKIDKIIHQLTLQYTDIWKEIYQFTLQVKLHPLKLTGMGLFYLGNECFRKFCVTIVMFVIIMVQMEIYISPD